MVAKLLVLGSALLAAMGSLPVFAADQEEIIDAPEIDIASTAASAQGWYVRGDVGYAAWMKGDRPKANDSQPFVITPGTFDDARFSRPVSVGLGVGYQFNDTFRADFTADIYQGDLDGHTDTAQPCSGAEPGGTSCRYSQDASYQAATLMANAYVDIATFAGFTPYVGAGAGMTNLRWDDLSSTARCRDGTAACSGTTYGEVSAPGQNSWRFTYALMAGASYQIAEGVKLDFGYRFSDVNGGDMFGYTGAERAGGASGVKGRDDGFQKHEFRAGIRIDLW